MTTSFRAPHILAVSIMVTTLPWGAERSALIMSVSDELSPKADLSLASNCDHSMGWSLRNSLSSALSMMVSSLAACGAELLAEGKSSFIPGNSRKVEVTMKKIKSRNTMSTRGVMSMWTFFRKLVSSGILSSLVNDNGF